MPFLFDTNIFLEILLAQDKKEKAKKFISDNSDQLFISDFSLHSIGVILLKQKKNKIFEDFVNDILPFATILVLSKNNYSNLIKFSEKYLLDFDDSYQVSVAVEYGLNIITMDKDFNKAKKLVKVKFL